MVRASAYIGIEDDFAVLERPRRGIPIIDWCEQLLEGSKLKPFEMLKQTEKRFVKTN